MIMVIVALLLWWSAALIFSLALCRASKKNPFEVRL